MFNCLLRWNQRMNSLLIPFNVTWDFKLKTTLKIGLRKSTFTTFLHSLELGITSINLNISMVGLKWLDVVIQIFDNNMFNETAHADCTLVLLSL